MTKACYLDFVNDLWFDLVELNCCQLCMITICGNYYYVLLIIRHAFFSTFYLRITYRYTVHTVHYHHTHHVSQMHGYMYIDLLYINYFIQLLMIIIFIIKYIRYSNWKLYIETLIIICIFNIQNIETNIVIIKKCPTMQFNYNLLIVLFSLLSLHYSLLPLSNYLVLFIQRLSWHITCEKNVTILVYYESIVYYTMQYMSEIFLLVMVLNNITYIPTSTNTLYYIYIIINNFYYTYCKNNIIYLLYYIGECVDRLIDIVCACTCITWWPMEQVIKCWQNEVERERVKKERVEREKVERERRWRKKGKRLYGMFINSRGHV